MGAFIVGGVILILFGLVIVLAVMAGGSDDWTDPS